MSRTAMTAEDFMRRAIQLSREGMERGLGGPFGAVVVKDGRIVGEGCNQVIGTTDPTAHAEVVAIRDACRRLGTFWLAGCEIYASCEPCPMCMGAIYWAHIERIWYANDREGAAAIAFDDDAIWREVTLPPERRTIPRVQLLAGEAFAVFEEWAAREGKIQY